MEAFILSYLSPLFFALVKLSLGAVILGLVVLAIRKVGEKRLSPFWKNALWLLVILALVIPYKLPSDHAILRENTFETFAFVEVLESSPEDLSPTASPNIVGEHAVEALKAESLNWGLLLPSIWLFGVIVMLLILILGHFSMKKKLLEKSLPEQEDLLEHCKKKLAIKKEVKLCYQTCLSSPALYGLLRPKILLPDYAEKLSEESLSYIFLHELCHLKHRDLGKNAVLLSLQVLHWFNPLIWLLFRFIRQDMEQLNDTRVLNILKQSEKKAYALSLVEVLGHANRLPLAPQMLTMVDDKGNTKRRIEMMKLGESFKRQRHVLALVCVTAIVLLSAVFFTEKPEEIPQVPASISMGIYTCEGILQENNLVAQPYLNFTEDSLLEFSFADYSSLYFSSLPYEIVGDSLQFSLRTLFPDEECIYVFNIEGDSLILDLEASENPYLGGVDIPHGTVFTWTTDTDIPKTMEKVILSQSVPIWPLNAVYTSLSAAYGERVNPITGETSFADGISIPAPEGEFIYAILAGEITETGYDSELGNYCILETEKGITAIYSHMSEIYVAKGDAVVQGKILGTVGQSGTATGTFLGYEIWEGDVSIDPVSYHEGNG